MLVKCIIHEFLFLPIGFLIQTRNIVHKVENKNEDLTHIKHEIYFIAARKRSLVQGNVFTTVCQSFFSWGGLCMMSLPIWLPGLMFFLGGPVPGPMFLLWVPLSRGSLSRGVSVWVVPVQGVSVYGVFIGSQIRKAGCTHPTGMHCCLLFWSLSCYIFFFRTLLPLNSKGLGVPVIASFENGIVFKFVKGQPLSDEQMRDKRIMRYDPALISHFTSNQVDFLWYLASEVLFIVIFYILSTFMWPLLPLCISN